MKKSVVMTVLGLAVAATASVHGQGAISIGNYRGAYNPVVWDSSLGGLAGQGVLSSSGVQLTLWYGAGNLSVADALTQSIALSWNTVAEGNGYAGYYNSVTLTLPDWTPGGVYTFQVRASGDTALGPAFGSSVLWQESNNIGDITGVPPGPAGFSANSIGLTVAVPEPSSLAIIGLGAAGLAFLRRRA